MISLLQKSRIRPGRCTFTRTRATTIDRVCCFSFRRIIRRQSRPLRAFSSLTSELRPSRRRQLNRTRPGRVSARVDQVESRTLRFTTFAVLALIAYTTAFTKCLPGGRSKLGYRSHQGFRRAKSGIKTPNQPLFRESLRLGFLFRKWFAPGRIGPTACYNTSRWGGFLRRCTGEPAKHRGKREPRLQTQKASIARTASS